MNTENILQKLQTKASILSEKKELKIRFSESTKHASYGMYVGVPNDPSVKQNRNVILASLPSNDYNDVHYFNTKEVYKRDAYSKEGVLIAKKGDTKVHKILNRYEHINSLKCMWMMASSQFAQVSYGVTKYRREVFIIDSDIHYSSLQQAKSLMIDFCSSHSLPFLSYLLRNPTSGHIQAGWFTEQPYIGSEAFNYHSETIRNLAQLYADFCASKGISDPKAGDSYFHGPSCKNPFWAGFEAEVYNNSVDKDSFSETCRDYINGVTDYYNSRKEIQQKKDAELHDINISSPLSIYNIEMNQCLNKSESTLLSQRKLTIVAGARQKNKFIEGSRDAYRCKALREWLWKNGMPNKSEAKDYYINTIMPAAAEATGKGLETWKETAPAFECTYQWAKKHYNPCNQHAKNASKLTALGSFTRTVNSFVEHIDILYKLLKRSDNESLRSFAAANNLSYSEVQRSSNIKYFTERLEAVEIYNSKVRNSSKSKVITAALQCYFECLALIQQKKDAELHDINISSPLSIYNIEMNQCLNKSESNIKQKESTIKTTYFDTEEQVEKPISTAIPTDYLEQLHNGDSYRQLRAKLDANYADELKESIF